MMFGPLDFQQFIEPIRTLSPAPLELGNAAQVTGLLDTPLAATAAKVLGGAGTGDAGPAIARSLSTAEQDLSRTMSAGRSLDTLGREAEAVTTSAINDLADIAQRCLVELQAAAPAALGGAAGGVAGSIAGVQVLMPIAMKYWQEASARTVRLEQELTDLAQRTAQVASEEIPQPSSTVKPSSVVTGSAGISNGGAAGVNHSDHTLSGDPVDTEPHVGSNGDAPTPEAARAVSAAKSAVGTPYRWGGSTPGQGMDCSGLTQWAYGQAGVDIPRVAADQAIGRQVSRSEVLPGDLVVWDGHVAMVIENGQMIEAGDPVQISPIREDNIGMGFRGYYRPTG